MSKNRLFISYSSKDESNINKIKLIDLLNNYNYPIYIQKKNLADEDEDKYASFIKPLIESNYLVAIITHNYLNDDFCESDIALAQNNSIFLIFLIIEKNIDKENLISNIQNTKRLLLFDLTDELKNGFGVEIYQFIAFLNHYLRKQQQPPQFNQPEPPQYNQPEPQRQLNPNEINHDNYINSELQRPTNLDLSAVLTKKQVKNTFKNLIENVNARTNDENNYVGTGKPANITQIDKISNNIDKNNDKNKNNDSIDPRTIDQIIRTIAVTSKAILILTNNFSKLPDTHFKCRYESSDEKCKIKYYTRTTDIFRFPVPKEKISWDIKYPYYTPTNFTSEKVKDRKTGGGYKDPDLNEPEYKTLEFNNEDKTFRCDRKSHHGPYRIVNEPLLEAIVPLNPVGRTGIIGRGHLGRWGPNHAADPIVTRWKRYGNKQIAKDVKSNKKILQFVAIQRKDTKEWAIPGGMRDPNEIIQQTLVREFAEEALSVELKFEKNGLLATQENVGLKFKEFFSNGTLIYKGYVDDPRNTDNAWMETVVVNFHDENSEVIGSLKLQSGSDAEKVKWMDLNSSLALFASHAEFLYKVAQLHNAHW